jgi:hypothetical protein
MWGCTCIPSTIYQVLYPLKRRFRCAQAQHLLVFCWLLTAVRHRQPTCNPALALLRSGTGGLVARRGSQPEFSLVL